MHQSDKLSSLTFNIIDKLTEDANTMISLQDNKSECIRTVFLDFVKANGIVNNYTDIPKRERWEGFLDVLHIPERMRIHQSLVKEGTSVGAATSSFFPLITVILTDWQTMSL